MHHLCPYPGGPVRIDPQPLTFSDTQGVFHSFRRVQFVSVQACVGVYMSARSEHESACSSLTFPLDYKVQARYTRRVFLSLFCCHSNERSS